VAASQFRGGTSFVPLKAERQSIGDTSRNKVMISNSWAHTAVCVFRSGCLDFQTEVISMNSEHSFITTIAMSFMTRERLDALRIKRGSSTGKLPPLRTLLTEAIEAYLNAAQLNQQ
jgi:hypothetical protein